MTKYIADHRQEGPGSIFFSCAPDDVHNPYSIRYSFPYVGRGEFPCEAGAAFGEALRAQTSGGREAFAHQRVTMGEASLQVRARGRREPSPM
eukprot:6960253-Prymnesium_polylepis.1